MCANYTPSAQAAWEAAFRWTFPVGQFKSESFPGYTAPIITNEVREDGVLATFGLLPGWAKPDLVRSTYNARSETAYEKPSFRHAWRRGQFCIIPADVIYEPNYETGSAVRWAIRAADGRALGIAGIWESRAVGKDIQYSFSMLTINADDHPVMNRMHKPGEEKRMVVILEPGAYDEWLQVKPEHAPTWLTQFPAERLVAEPAPRGATRQAALI